MFATFLTPYSGVGIYTFLQGSSLSGGAAVRPDWTLGILFGAGGLAGSYGGARLQKHLPERWIKLTIGVLITILAAQYIAQFFR